ncbi:Importin subunit alpha-1 [Cardamine amara subsp. amara]|uniref:Importin subunit alpha n=1 Tax=Cardamine amara subsp. amara TaxID=228776 RepID=A0ABD0ZKK7_CARAN
MSLRPSEKTEARKNRYKLAVDAEEGRRRRGDYLVEIRKNKREESLMKKRRDCVKDSLPPSDAASSSENKLEILSMIAGVWSDDPSLQINSTTQFRKMLSTKGTMSPKLTDDVIQSGVVPRFVDFLKKEDFPLLQLEAAWVLTNIASGTSEHTKVVIDHEAVPIFIQLLASPVADVREQAIWALGNVAGDSTQCRDYVLSCGAFMPLLAQVNKNATLLMLRNTAWTLANFFRRNPLPPFDQIQLALPVLERLLHLNDREVVADACWSLSYLCDGSVGNIQSVIETGVVPRLVKVLQRPLFSPGPALSTIGNIVTGNHQQTQCVINCGALPVLANLLNHQNYKKVIKIQACWTISNITAGNKEQIQAVIDADLIPTLVNVVQNAEFGIKKEALWAISNVTSCGSHDQIKYLVEQSCMKPLCDLLVCPDLRIITECLEVLGNILIVGEEEKENTGGVNYYSQLIEDAEGIEKIENLQYHDNYNIYEKAMKIIQTFWLEEDQIQNSGPM